MFLGKDGKYYLDRQQNVEMTSELIYQVYKKLSPFFFASGPVSFVHDIQGKNYNFLYSYSTLYYIDENNKKYELKIQSLKIIFRVAEKDYKREIFTYEQFEKNLENFKISFTWSENIIVTKENIIDRIKNNDRSYLIVIENIDFKSLIKPQILKLEKFKDLSLYISYYLKSGINIEKYEENNFLDKNIFDIDPEAKIEFFFLKERIIFLDKIIKKFKEGIKEYFFTGLPSIGKTLTLLYYNFEKESSIKKAYFNLKTFKKNKKFFEIIIYESQCLFDNLDKWEEAFISLKDRINDSKDFLLILLNLIKLLAEKYINEGKKYVIILDQIDFGDKEYNDINLIREVVQKTKNLYLIGCCSLNYKGVKDILFNNWSKEKEAPNEKNIPNIEYINFFKFNDKNNINNNSNKYLNLLGNLPKFKNIEDKLNSKIINLFIKKTKEKFLKFYYPIKSSEFEKIDNIPVLKKFENKKNFLENLGNIPFKYFMIFEEENMFDYSCPIIKRVIEELLEENKLNKKFIDYNFEFDWYFEKRVIYAIRFTNLIPNKYYIDNSYLIPTIYLPYKVENLDHKENSLFYFEFNNIKRYNCAIYLGNEKAFILIEISINIQNNKLEQYNSNNFQTDLEEFQKFIRINKLQVQKYYFLFILLYSNYQSENFLKIINEKEFSYIFYDLDEEKFIGEIRKDENLYEIKNTVDSEKNIDITENYFVFGKINGSFDYKYCGKYYKYYAIKNMTLDNFFNEIFGEEIKDEFRKNTNIELTNFNLYSFNCNYYQGFFNEINKRILLLNFKDYEIYYGIGGSKDNFIWHSYNIVYRIKKYLKKNIGLSTMNCFLFICNKILSTK